MASPQAMRLIRISQSFSGDRPKLRSIMLRKRIPDSLHFVLAPNSDQESTEVSTPAILYPSSSKPLTLAIDETRLPGASPMRSTKTTRLIADAMDRRGMTADASPTKSSMR